MRRAVAFALSLSTALAFATASCGDALGPDGAHDRLAIFDDLWHQVDLHYSHFGVRDVDWNAVGTRYRTQAANATTDAELATAAGEMLASLEDVHVSLAATGGVIAPRYVSPYETVDRVDSRVAIARASTDAGTTAGGHIQYGRVDDHIGYLRIPSFAGGAWDGEMDAALAKLATTSALIIDIRDNHGGDPALAVALAGRFADRAHTFGYLSRRNGPRHTDFGPLMAETVMPSGGGRYSRPVFVLTNRGCFSSAETFVLAMRALPSVVVVGDTTAGASGGPIVRELANGWTYQLSEWIEYTASRQPFEGIGLAPDDVSRTVSSVARGTDSALDRAIQRAHSVALGAHQEN